MKIKPKKRVLTTGDIARDFQVTHFTVTNWINAGKLRAYRTPGGHHRIRYEDYMAFLQTYPFPVPEVFPPSPAARILVVDEDAAVGDFLIETLQQAGYQVASAGDEYEAGQKIMTFTPDLVMVNLCLPSIDGIDFCTRIKGNPQTSAMKILAFTSTPDAELRDQVLVAAVDAWLDMPVSEEQLLTKIHHLLSLNRESMRTVKGVERRKSRRFDIALPIQYTLHLSRRETSEHLTGQGKTRDIGRGGLLLETALPVQPANLLDLAIVLHQDKQPIQAVGSVQWVKSNTTLTRLVGVQFTEIAEHARTQLVDTLVTTAPLP